MTLLRATVKMPYATNRPERDTAENVFHFWNDHETLDNLEDMIIHWHNGLLAFYQLADEDALGISSYLSRVVDRDACTIEWRTVDMANGHVSNVWTEGSIAMNAAAGTAIDLPLEVALCLTMIGQPNPDGGPVLRRRRGRIYIGPLTGETVQTSGSPTYPIPNQAFCDAVAFGAEALVGYGNQAGGSGTSDDGDWVVYSRSGSNPTGWVPDDGPTAGGKVTYVREGWVDNAWDTQRRRGVEALIRNPWAFNPP